MYKYIIESYSDPMFLLFPIYTTLLGVCFFLFFALPLSFLAYKNPEKLRKYRVSNSPINVQKYFFVSLKKVFTHNFILLLIVCSLWPLARNFGVHNGELPVWYMIIFYLLIFLFVDDFLTYWVHKLLHRGWFYKNIHSVHHQINHPSAMDNAYFHWVEYLLIVSTGQIAPLLMGAHIYVIWGWLFIRIWQSVVGHCGYVFPWSPLKLIPMYEGGDYHYFHHIDQRGNISGILPYLDRIWGKVSPSYQDYKKNKVSKKRILFLKLKW